LILISLCFALTKYQLLNLCGDRKNSDPSSLRGEAIDENFANDIMGIDSKIALFRLKQYEMMTAYLYSQWDIVSMALIFFKANEKALVEGFVTDFSHVWAAICYYDLYLETGKHKYKKEGKRTHRKVKGWAVSGAKIFVAPTHLLNAWASLCQTKPISVIQTELDFNDAISECAAAKCILFEALGNERLARYFIATGSDHVKGLEYHQKAILLYRKWGAFKRADWLESLDYLRHGRLSIHSI
jgi:hypothetical protein